MYENKVVDEGGKKNEEIIEKAVCVEFESIEKFVLLLNWIGNCNSQ